MPEPKENKFESMDDVLKIDDPSVQNDAMRELAKLEIDRERNPEKYKEKEVIEDSEEPAREDTGDEEDVDIEEEKLEDTEPDEDTSKDTLEEKDTVEESESEEDVTKLITDYATKKEMSEEDAKEEFESVAKNFEKYGGDRKDLKPGDTQYEIIKGMINTHRMATKAQMELNEIKKKTAVKYHLDNEKLIWDGKEYSRADVVEDYRKNKPATSRDLDDDQVWEKAVADLQVKYETLVKKNQEDLGEKASEIRTSMINSIPDVDVVFSKEIREIVENAPVQYIIQDDGTFLETAINSVRGKHYHEDVERIKKEWFKKGQEQAKILGEKKQVTPSTSKTKVAKKHNLTKEQEQEALIKFSNQDVSDDIKFEMMQELVDLRKKLAKDKKQSA